MVLVHLCCKIRDDFTKSPWRFEGLSRALLFILIYALSKIVRMLSIAHFKIPLPLSLF